MSTRKPTPKSQSKIFRENVNSYLNQNLPPSVEERSNNRGYRTSAKGDDVKKFTIGLKDIDEAIVYYFNNVIKPSVTQNGNKLNVPIIYGSPERWASVQRDGYYRDKNGKIQAPLIMFKRDSVEKNRSLGNKLDANNPTNFGIFKKNYSKRNYYDRFSALTNREPEQEFYAVAIPDYVNITYSCIVFTDYVEQMNKIIESINYASDAYWGNPDRFRFRAMIDSYSTPVETVQGEDRKVRTEFTINLLGHIIPDSINSNLNGLNKFYSKSRILFQLEVDNNIETLTAKSKTADKEAPTRFFDSGQSSGTGGVTGYSKEQLDYLALNNVKTSTSILSPDKARFAGTILSQPPIGINVTFDEPRVFINGVLIPTENRTIVEEGGSITVTIKNLNFELAETDQIILVGKIE